MSHLHHFAETLASIDLKNAIIPKLLQYVQPLRDKINENKILYNNAYPKEMMIKENQPITIGHFFIFTKRLYYLRLKYNNKLKIFRI